MVEETFGERLETLVKEKGLKRAALQKMTGAAAGTVSEWFTQGSTPGGTYLTRLAEGLGVRAEWLVSGEGSRESENVGAMLRRAAGDIAKQHESADWSALLAEEIRASAHRAETERLHAEARAAEARAAERRIELLSSCRQSPNGDDALGRGRDEEAEQVTVTPDDKATGP